ncbi:MAG TPA: hypothetical protein DIV41_03845 [Ruminococcaceae bacterium]|jgi:apolipoprotein N-acyltransferase|nr:hypothetical protein [Oscillospiraceae bacterium]
MAYLLAAVWFLAGLILIFRMGRENRVFYPIGAFFLFLGAWWLANSLGSVNMFAGAWGIALRVITAAVLVFSYVVLYRDMKKNREQYKNEDKSGRPKC